MTTETYLVRAITTHTNLPTRRVYKGEGYAASFVADAGYSVYEVKITMGGLDITSSVYDAAHQYINIPHVTADVEIEVYAMHSMPSDYVRVDGIKAGSPESNGSYLDTGYKVTPNSRLEIKMTLARYAVYTYYAGSKHDNNSKNGSGWFTDTASTRYVKVYNNLSDRISTGLLAPIDDNVYHELILDYYKKTHSVKGGPTVTLTEKTSVDDDNFHLFRPLKSNGTLVPNSSLNTIGYFHIYDYSTTSYVRYYIPCLNDSGVAGFWDAARGAFVGSSNSTAFEAVYVTTNLIARYDGIYNAGVGTHDADATTWKDLAGSNDAAVDVVEGYTCEWQSDGWVASNGGVRFKADSAITTAINNHDFTMEYVICPSGITLSSGQPPLSTNRTSSSITSYITVSHKRSIYVHIKNVLLNAPDNLITNNTTYHVAVRKSGTDYAIFVNGTKVASSSSSADCSIHATASYWIGGDASSSYKGKFLAHRVYTKSLSDDEIKGNYAIDKIRFNF